MKYVVDITAYNHVSTIFVEADTESEAIAKAQAEKNITLKVRK